jgi:hypothetical protein
MWVSLLSICGDTDAFGNVGYIPLVLQSSSPWTWYLDRVAVTDDVVLALPTMNFEASNFLLPIQIQPRQIQEPLQSCQDAEVEA